MATDNSSGEDNDDINDNELALTRTEQELINLAKGIIS